ncbi:glycosyl transferase family 2 [Serinicoccus chungangensis]|uniref:Glucosyl-3-phosphoglycerate synthase n=1 Tax=Serinicoccus chungangensis TaxID=767452 RepID=A0A0W8I2M2_9MICO|nr:glycosyltransferase [Serinicoccus chungangensis]KUG51976.1 glycosyl transferase family 2 [Serinicoccus chungangensis]
MSASQPVEGVPQELVVAVVPAKDEESRIGATLAALQRLPQVGEVVVVDDGSTDQTAHVAAWSGRVEVVRHERNRGKAAAMTTGVARAQELRPGAPVLFVDADLEESAAELGPIITPVLVGRADMTIAVLPPQPGAAGLGLVVRTASAGIRRLTGWEPTQPLSGQRCLTREALLDAMPLARGWGVEVGLTIDVIRSGGRVLEIPCEVRHRATGRDLSSQAHRARQLADVSLALAERSGVPDKVREGGLEGSRIAREQGARIAQTARERGVPLARRTASQVGEQVQRHGRPLLDRARAAYEERARRRPDA